MQNSVLVFPSYLLPKQAEKYSVHFGWKHLQKYHVTISNLLTIYMCAVNFVLNLGYTSKNKMACISELQEILHNIFNEVTSFVGSQYSLRLRYKTIGIKNISDYKVISRPTSLCTFKKWNVCF